MAKKTATARKSQKSRKSPRSREASKPAAPWADIEKSIPKSDRAPIKTWSKLPDSLIRVQTEQSARRTELQRQWFAAQAVMERHRNVLMSHNNVVGVHIGFRRVNDEICYPLEYCVRVSVEKKFRTDSGRIHDPIPSKLDGVRVDVSERTFALIGEPNRLANRRRLVAQKPRSTGNVPFDNFPFSPIRGGIVIANEKTPDNWGTLGLTLRTKDGGSVLITCAHVAVSGDDSAKNIIQPTVGIGGAAHRIVGRVSSAVRNQLVDVALIEKESSIDVRTKRIVGANRKFLDADLVRGEVVAMESNLAFKVGAASDPGKLVLGRIQAVNASVFIQGFGEMTDQIIVERINTNETIISPGDSGAVLLKSTGTDRLLEVVGLVHSQTSDGNAMVACHWRNIRVALPDLDF